LKDNDENKKNPNPSVRGMDPRIRIRIGSTPKCHETATLTTGFEIKFLFTKNSNVLVTFGRYS
jgi:hypothetical protein